MTVRCKFRCNEIVERESQRSVKGKDEKYNTIHFPLYSAVMTPVYSEDPQHENKAFWDATPSGKFEVGTILQMPWKVGAEYYLDISPAPG